MMGAIRSAKRGVQMKQVSYVPNLFQKLIIYRNGWHVRPTGPRPTGPDESDVIEEKFEKLPNQWGGTTIRKID